MTPVGPFESESRLQEYLEDASIHPAQWEKGIIELWNELVNGESQLVLTEAGDLRRVLKTACAKIYYVNSAHASRWYLYEAMRFIAGKPTKIRRFPVSIAEKMKVGEDPYEAVARGLTEELTGYSKPDISMNQLPADMISTDYTSRKEEKFSGSFKGLTSIYHHHDFRVVVPTDLYDPKGYKEVVETSKGRRITHFRWRLEAQV